ncbi:hypothetical protein [Nocardioides sp. MH1]|uniref:hypothetical protein n=1 Tax=Nocardioides sp. MH1 TaxID=3242490 RepID=UPI0035209DD2
MSTATELRSDICRRGAEATTRPSVTARRPSIRPTPRTLECGTTGRASTAGKPEGGNEIVVRVEGCRHDNNNDDWSNTICATNTSPGSLGEVELKVADARRLAHALLLACDLTEARSWAAC